MVAGAVGGEDAGEPVDRRREPAPALVEAGLLGQMREQAGEPLAGDGEKAPIRRQPHDRLGDAEGDDLGICDPPARVLRLFRQEIVGAAIDGREEKVEVGIHRGPPVVGDGLITADFGLSHPFSLPLATDPVPSNRLPKRESVESLI